jgi:putative membrane protein
VRTTLFRLAGLCAGGAALGYVLAQVDGAALLATLADGGLMALGVVCLWHALPLMFDALGWLALSRADERLSLPRAMFYRWLGESINALLPVAQVGGDLVRARMWTKHNVMLPRAMTIVFSDVLLTALSQVPFAVLGLILLMDDTFSATSIVTGVLIAVGAALFTTFPVAERIMSMAVRHLMPRRLSASTAVWEAELTAAPDVAARLRSFSAHLVAWLIGIGEIYLAAMALGIPLSVGEALVIEALLQAVRSAAFLVPAALGVQEAGIVAVGLAIGLGAPESAAIAAIRRGRELALGLPGVVVWQYIEWRALGVSSTPSP